MAKPKSSTIIICTMLFFFGLVISFPFQNLRGFIFDKIYASTGILIVAEDIHLLLLGWPGVGMKKVNVSLPVGDNDIELSSEKLQVRARLSHWFVPSISLYLKELKKGGDLYIKAGRRFPMTHFNLEADALNLEQIAIPGLNQGVLGTIDSDLSFSYDQSEPSRSSGYVTLSGHGIKTPPYLINNPMFGPAFQIPGLVLGSIEVVGEVNNGAFEVQKFQIGSPKSDLSATLTGDLKFERTLDDSTVNFTLKVHMDPKILNNPENNTFLAFFSAYKTDKVGEYSMRWVGTVKQIMGNPIPVR